MKGLAILVLVVLFSQLAEAKTILYVANAATDTTCSELSSPDSLYCNRMAGLGYDMKVIDEQNAVDSSTTWNNYLADSDVIFLGSNSADMANVKKSMYAFCGNISASGKPLFVTSASTIVTNPDTMGCGIFLGIVSADFSDNRCNSKAFKAASPGFITEGLRVDGNVTIYSSASAVSFYNISDGGWITAECDPVNHSIDFYPVLYADSRNVFWGLDNPSIFTAAAWDIFDRTVLSFMNDTAWPVAAFALPSVGTVNQNILIFANVTQLGKPVNGTVNFSSDGPSGSMARGDFWNASVSFAQPAMHYVNVAAYSKSLRGYYSLPVNVGSLVVNITSAEFEPDSNYTVSALVHGSTHASYRILDTNYSVILSGDMGCINDVCTGVVSSMPDENSLLLEVTAYGDSVGGTLKAISKNYLATDRDSYSPGETMSIDLFSPTALTNASLTIIRPDGTKETPSPINMLMESSTHFSKNYTLGAGSPNGTYTIEVKAVSGAEYKKSVDVIAWNPYAYLNKNYFDVFDNVVVSVGVAQAYSSDLAIKASARMTLPNYNVTDLGSTTIKGNGLAHFTFMIPKGYPSGLTAVAISFSDQNNRSATLHLNFSTNETILQPSLFVTPSVISITSIPGYTVDRIVTLENTAKVDASNIITNVSSDYVSVIGISSLSAGTKASTKISINTNGLTGGTYTEYVNFYSQVGDADVTIMLEIIGDISSEASQKYAELSSIESNITYLSKLWANTSDSDALISSTRDMLNRSIDEYNSGNYESAKADLEEASANIDKLQSQINGLYGNLPDNSYIVWYFALIVVAVIITVTVVKVKTRSKKRKAKKVVVEPKKEEVLFEPKGGEYRTEYY